MFRCLASQKSGSGDPLGRRSGRDQRASQGPWSISGARSTLCQVIVIFSRYLSTRGMISCVGLFTWAGHLEQIPDLQPMLKLYYDISARSSIRFACRIAVVKAIASQTSKGDLARPSASAWPVRSKSAA